jgi:hypothetical protein
MTREEYAQFGSALTLATGEIPDPSTGQGWAAWRANGHEDAFRAHAIAFYGEYQKSKLIPLHNPWCRLAS